MAVPVQLLELELLWQPGSAPMKVLAWESALVVLVLGAQPLLWLLQPGFLRWTVRSGVL